MNRLEFVELQEEDLPFVKEMYDYYTLHTTVVYSIDPVPMIYGLVAYPEDVQKALDFAMAASCLKNTVSGDFNLVTVSEVENLMKGDGSGRVSR